MSNATIATDVPYCLCHVVLNTLPTLPKLLYNRKDNVFLMYCPTCGFKTFPDLNKQAVIASWFSSNRPSDEHIKVCWMVSYNKQIGTSVPK